MKHVVTPLVLTLAFVAHAAAGTILVLPVGDRYPQPIKEDVVDARAIRVGTVTGDGFPALAGQEGPEVDIAAVAATTIDAARLVAATLSEVETALPQITIDEARALLVMTARPTLWHGVGALDAKAALEKTRVLAPTWPRNRATLRAAIESQSFPGTRERILAGFGRENAIERRLEALRAAGSHRMIELVAQAFDEGLQDMLADLSTPDARQLATVAMASAPTGVLDLSGLAGTPEPVALELLEAACLMDRMEYASLLIDRVRRDRIDIAPFAAQGLHDVVEWLLQRGAPIEGASARFGTPLVAAVGARDGGATARFLLSRGANPNRLSPSGESPLTVAVSRANADTVRLLVTAGADSSIGRRRGKDAFALAREQGQPEVLAALGLVKASVAQR